MSVATATVEPCAAEAAADGSQLDNIEIDEVDMESSKLVPTKPFSLTPILVDSGQFIRVEYEPFNLIAVAGTRDELVQDLCEILHFLWEKYAMANDSILAKSGLRLKHELLRSFQEVERSAT